MIRRYDLIAGSFAYFGFVLFFRYPVLTAPLT
jgi:hypothetical protein